MLEAQDFDVISGPSLLVETPVPAALTRNEEIQIPIPIEIYSGSRVAIRRPSLHKIRDAGLRFIGRAHVLELPVFILEKQARSNVLVREHVGPTITIIVGHADVFARNVEPARVILQISTFIANQKLNPPVSRVAVISR